MAFDPDAYLQKMTPAPSQGTAAPPPDFDPDVYLASVSGQKQADKTPQSKQITDDQSSMLKMVSQTKSLESYPIATSIQALGSIGGGLRGLWDLALGKGGEKAASDVGTAQDMTAPTGPAASISSSPYNPINIPGEVLDYAGSKLADVGEKLGASPGVLTALRVTPTAAGLAFGAKSLKQTPESESEGINASGFENETEEQTPAQQKEAASQRENILTQAGIQNARNSALEANKKDAATDFQLSRTDTPAGNEAQAQFEHETETMKTNAQGIVDSTGGTPGLGEDALNNRGRIMATPFDKLRQWFEQRTGQLYGQAQQRSDQLTANGDPQARTFLPSVNNLLNDPTFNNELAANNQGGLLGAVRSQLQFFRDQNPQGLTPAVAEQFRQFLNKIWSPQTKYAIGRLVGATDDDVLNNAGEDIYAPARAMSALKKQTLDNPNGVADIFSSDPKTPINRATPYEKIPDAVARLSVDQFNNVVDTIKNMPDELQSDAQAAINEIKSHFANKILQAGSETKSGVTRNLWNSDSVNNFIKLNALKIKSIFSDDPETLANIKNLQDAGIILKVDPSYPGAYAQEINLKGRGVVAKALPTAGQALGAAAGAPFGPTMAAGGAAAGRAAGATLASRAEAAAAIKAWKTRVKKLGP